MYLGDVFIHIYGMVLQWASKLKLAFNQTLQADRPLTFTVVLCHTILKNC